MKESNNAYKYKAFISYSHQNEKFGKWLHKSLEKYKIPKELRKVYPELPDKLYPIFRDREELPTSSDLSKNILQALEDSKYLIVICSVASAKSFWVNQEIIDFKRMHGEDRILAIILDGEPHAKDSDKFDDKLECFPEALKYKVIDEKLSDEQTEPIAGDVREGKDGKEFGKLKLIAGLLGVGFEELYRREEKKERQRRAFLIGALGGVSALAGVSAWKWIEASQKSIALEKQKVVLQEEVERAKHNVGLALAEKAYYSVREKNYLKANLYANYALQKLNDNLDKNHNKAKLKGFSVSYSYSKMIFYKELSDFILSISISHDDMIFITGSMDSNIRIWDLKSGKLLQTLIGHKNGIYKINISEDRKRIVSISYDYMIKVWDLKSGKTIYTFRDYRIKSPIFSKNGREIIYCFNDTINIWDIKSKKIVKTSTIYSGLNSLLLSDDKEKIISSSKDGKLQIWSSTDIKLLYVLNNNTSIDKNVFNKINLVLATNQMTIVTGSESGEIRIWDLNNLKSVHTVIGHPNSRITNIAISKNSKRIFSASEDGTIKIWNVKSGALLETLRVSLTGINGMAISNDGRTLISVENNSIKIWDISKNKSTFDKMEHLDISKIDSLDSVSCIKILENKKMIISGASDNKIKIWDFKSQKLTKTLEGHIGRVSSINIFNNGKSIISSSWDKTIKVWDMKNGKVLKNLRGHTGLINCSVISQNEKFIISGGDDGIINVWDIKNNKILQTLFHKGSIQHLIIKNDNKTIISVSNQFAFDSFEDIKIWNLNTGQLLFTLLNRNTFSIIDIDISLNEKFLISSSLDGTIKMWDIKNGKLLKVITTSRAAISSIKISNDMKYLIVASFDKSINIWNIESAKLIKKIMGYSGSINNIDITNDNKFIVSALSDGTLKKSYSSGFKKQKNIEKKINYLEQQVQAKLEGIMLIPTKIPYIKPLWSKQHPNHWLEKAEKGNPKAMYELGLIYDRDNENNKALEWYKKASAKGYSEAEERVVFLEEWIKNNT